MKLENFDNNYTSPYPLTYAFFAFECWQSVQGEGNDRHTAYWFGEYIRRRNKALYPNGKKHRKLKGKNNGNRKANSKRSRNF